MADDDRMHRPEPERTGPNRGFAGLFKSDPWSERDDYWHQRNGSNYGRRPESESHYTHASSFEGGTGPFDGAAASFANVAQQAVDLAYRISEPYLRAGLRAAEAYTARENGTGDRFETPFEGGDAMNRPYGDPMAQMYGQLARAYAEFMVSMARAAYGAWGPQAYPAYPRRRDWCGPYDGPDDRSRCYPPPPPSYCEPPPQYGPPSWKHRHWHRLEVETDTEKSPKRRASVSKQQYRYSEHPKLALLQCTKPPYATLAVTERAHDGIVIYTVKVDDNTAPGTYYGPITDDKTGQVIGNVTIEITER